MKTKNSREFCIWHLGYNFRKGGSGEILCLEFIDLIESCFREFYVAVGDDSGIAPKLLCGRMSPVFILMQAHKVLLLSHAERDTYEGEGFLVFYSTLNQSVSEGKEQLTFL